MWIDEIPEVGGKYLERAREITQRKQELRAALDSYLRAEADLWSEIGRTGEWTRREMAAALVKMDPAVLPFLPDRMVGKPSRRKR